MSSFPPLFLASSDGGPRPTAADRQAGQTAPANGDSQANGNDASVTTQSGAPGGTTTGGGGGGGSFFGPELLTIMIVVLGAMLLFSVFAGRKEKKRRQAMLNALQKGDKVQTIGGILGTVVEVRDNEVVVKVDESSNTRMRFARQAIANVLDSHAPQPAGK